MCAIYLDGIEFKGQHLLVALGVNSDGAKTVLGMRQGASENAVVVSALLGDLAQRGVDFSTPRLYVLDGAKALVKAVREHAGAAALIQRCQVHKRRNVVGHLSEEYREQVDRRLAAAYALTSTAEAKRELEQLHRELQELNPSAARSLAEGLDETLTVNRLPLEGWLRRTMATTNPIESAFSVVDTVQASQVLQRGDHLERWEPTRPAELHQNGGALRTGATQVMSLFRITIAAACLLAFTCPRLGAQTLTMSGQLLAEDSLQSLPHVKITATSMTRPVEILEGVTGPDGRFSLNVKEETPYRLCSAATGSYADSCRFSKPFEVTPTADMPTVQMTAPTGVRMRITVVDHSGLLVSPQRTLAARDPQVLHIFADEAITQTRIPLEIELSPSVANAVDAAAVVPLGMQWSLGMSSERGLLLGSDGQEYKSNTPISRPPSVGSGEHTFTFTFTGR